MKTATTFFLSAFITLTLAAASASAFAAKGGESGNVNCNGQGNANSPCAGGGTTTPPTTPPPETTPPTVVQGPKGDPGAAGAPGRDGKDGESVAGKDGRDGQDGKPGVTSYIEVPDTATQAKVNSATQRLDSMQGQIDRNEKQANAGTAGALAAASIPQSPESGKAVLGLGGGVYRGASAAALGISYRSTNGRTTTKGFVTVDNQGGAGLGIGAAFQFE